VVENLAPILHFTLISKTTFLSVQPIKRGKIMIRKLLTSLLLTGALLACTSGAALALHFDSSSSNIYYGDTPSGISVSATADFNIVSNQLQIILTNTGAAATQNIDVLQALFFTVAGPSPFVTQGTSSATADTLINAPLGTLVSSNTDIGNYWAYKSGLSVYSLFNAGISACGLGVFGPGDLIKTAGAPNGQPGGGDYGIVNGLASGNSINSNKNPYVDDTVTILLSLPAGFDLNNITGVGFQYGTALGSNTPVPEPGTFVLLGSALLGLAAFGRKRTRK
jgi:PEP-CTERM motif